MVCLCPIMSEASADKTLIDGVTEIAQKLRLPMGLKVLPLR